MQENEQRNNVILAKDILTETLTRLETLKKCKNGITGITTGFYDLDYTIKGLNKGDLIILASRPAMGKTSLLLNIATNVAKQDKAVVVFNLEMSKEQCISSILSSQSKIERIKTNSGHLTNDEWKKIATVIEELLNVKLYIDDTPAISIEEIKKKCIRLKQEKNIELVVIDYFQLISRYKYFKNTEQGISYISKELKKLARELDVPVIVTSQLSKDIEGREDKRPIIKDLKFAEGSMIQDADVIMFLYRDYFYDTNTENKGIAEVIVAKNRYGNNTTIELKDLLVYGRFENLEYKEQ